MPDPTYAPPQKQLPFSALVGKMKSIGVLPQDATPAEELEAISGLYDRKGVPPEIKQQKLAEARAEREPIHAFNAQANEQQRIKTTYGPEAEQRFIGEMAMQTGAYGRVPQALNWISNRLNVIPEGVESAAGGIAGALGGTEVARAMRERTEGLRSIRGANLPQNTATEYTDVGMGFIPYVAGSAGQGLIGAAKSIGPMLFGAGAERAQAAGHEGALESAGAGLTETAIGLAGGQLAGRVLGGLTRPLAPRVLAPLAETAAGGAGLSLGMTSGQSTAGALLGDQQLASEPWTRWKQDAALLAAVSALTGGHGAIRRGLADVRSQRALEAQQAEQAALVQREADALEANRQAAGFSLGASAPMFDPSKVQISAPRSIGESAGISALQPSPQQYDISGFTPRSSGETVVPSRTIVTETPPTSGGLTITPGKSTVVPAKTVIPETPTSSGGIALSQSGKAEPPTTHIPEAPKTSGGIDLSQSGTTPSTVKTKPAALKVTAIYEGEPIQGEYLGDTVSGGARIGIQDGREVVVNKSTMQVLSEEPSRARSISQQVSEPIKSEIIAQQEAPSSETAKNNRGKSITLGATGLERFVPSPDLSGATTRGAKQVVRGASTLGKAVKETVGSVFTLKSAHDQMLRNGLEPQAEAFKQIEGEQQSLKMSPRANELRTQANVKATEVGEHKSLLNPEAPTGGTGMAWNRMDELVTGKATPKTDFERRAVAAARGVNRYTGEAASNIEGMHTGDPTGKTPLHYLTSEALNLLSNTASPARAKFIELLAKKNGKTIEDIERAFADMNKLREVGDGVVVQNALELTRQIKQMPTDFWYDNAHYQIRDNALPSYVNRTINGAANRIPIVKKFGPNLDPSGSTLASGDRVVPKNATPQQLAILRDAFRAAHEIGTDQTMLSKASQATATSAPAVKEIYDVGKRGVQLISKPIAGAALSFSEASGILGFPAFVGNVGARGLLRGIVDFARDPSGKKLAKDGQLQQMLIEMGGRNRMEQASNIVSQLGIKGRVTDYWSSQILAHSALHYTRQMQKGLGNRVANTAMLMELGYGEAMAKRMAEGKGSASEYSQAARDIVQQATGHGRSDLSAARLERSAIMKALLPFMRFSNARVQQMFRQYHVARTAKDPGVRNAAGLHLAKSIGANITGGASIALGMAFVAAGASGVKQLLENPEELAYETWWRGLVGPAQTWMGKLFNSNQSAAETVAKLSLPAGATIDTAKNVVEAFKTKSWDPIKELFFLRTTGAKYGRDALAWATEIDPGVQPAARRKAIGLFYKFAKSHPELLDSPIQEGFQVEATPLTAALRKLPKGKYGNPEALAQVLIEGKIIGKDEKDLKTAILRKRLMPRFKKQYEPYAMALLWKEVGNTAFNELIQHDMIIDALAGVFK